MQTSANKEMCFSSSMIIDNDKGFYFYYYDFFNDDELRLDYDLEITRNVSEKKFQPFTRYSSDSQLYSIKKSESILNGFNNTFSTTALNNKKSADSKMSKFNTFKLLSRTANIFQIRQPDLDSFMSGLNDRLESNNNDDVWDEVIDFDDIDTADGDEFKYFVETSTPSGELEETENKSLSKKNEKNGIELMCNDFVSINDKERGFLRYVGKVHFTEGIHGGVELIEADGSHDGQFEGVRYFQCEQNHGIFAPIEKIQLVRSAIPLKLKNSRLSLSPSFHFKTIQDIQKLNESSIYLNCSNNLNDSSITDNEIAEILTQKQSLKSPPTVLNKTFDLTETMIASRQIAKPECKLSSGLVKPSNILGCKSTSSCCSTTSSTSSSSSSNNFQNTRTIPPLGKKSNLQFQLKLDKFNQSGNNSKNISYTSTPNGKVNNLSKHNGSDSTSTENLQEPAKSRTSKLNQPTKLLKYKPSNTATNPSTTITSGLAGNCRIPAQTSLLKKQPPAVATTPSLNKSVKPSTSTKQTILSKIANTKTNNNTVDSKINYEPIKLQTLPVNTVKSNSSISTTCSDTKSELQISSAAFSDTKSSIPSFGIVKQHLSQLQNVKPTKTVMIANSNLQKPSPGSGLKRPLQAARPTPGTSISIANKETKVDLPANVKSKSRSSSNNSTSSHSSTTQVKPALSKLSQLNRMTSSVAEPSAISMYQPSISMLAKPVINTTKLLNQKHEKAIEDDLEEACKTNQMNETFEIVDEKPDKNTVKEIINQQKQNNEDKRRESILLIENNFEIMNNEHSMRKNSLLGGYLESEEMPDFLLDDCITDTNTSNVTVQLKGENNNNNNSLLDVDSFNHIFDNSPSLNNNLQWLNSSYNIRKSQQSPSTRIISTDNEFVLNKSINEEQVLPECKLILDELVAKIGTFLVENTLTDINTQCEMTMTELVNQIVKAEETNSIKTPRNIAGSYRKIDNSEYEMSLRSKQMPTIPITKPIALATKKHDATIPVTTKKPTSPTNKPVVETSAITTVSATVVAKTINKTPRTTRITSLQATKLKSSAIGSIKENQPTTAVTKPSLSKTVTKSSLLAPTGQNSSISQLSSVNKSSSSIGSVKTASDKEQSTTLATVSVKKVINRTPRTTRITSLQETKLKTSNKENQQNNDSLPPKSLAMSKIYKSRDGLAAVSSNTSIMSEVSNLSINSKTSLQSSIPTSTSVRSTKSANTGLLNNRQTPQLVHRLHASTPSKPASLIKKIGLVKPINESLSVNTGTNVDQVSGAQCSPSPSTKAKNEITLKNNEIKRLEALCESRTKELSLSRMKLRDTLISFEAIVVAYNYLANDLNGYEVTSLKDDLRKNRRKLEESVKTLQGEIEAKTVGLKKSEIKLKKLQEESNETNLRLEAKLKSQAEKHENECILIQKQADLMIGDVQTEKESSINRLNKQIELTRVESDALVTELREQLKNKQSENIELETRIKECEETLAKDSDERIQRLVDIQRNLEKEIESLKTALDIKNADLFELRTRNNELTTKLDNYNELDIKYRRYKHELENLHSILENKKEQERVALENNRMLSLKVETKARENQRLSMQNEQLQFRLQSHSNLSLAVNDHENSFNLSNISISNDNSFFSKLSHEQHLHDLNPSYYEQYQSLATTMPPASIDATNNETPVVKLRSKSCKSQLSYDPIGRNAKTQKNFHSFHHSPGTNSRQFRPVSDTFNFELNEEHDFRNGLYNFEMTRSEYNDDDLTDTHNTTCSLTDALESNGKFSDNNSNCSSTSLLDSQGPEDGQIVKSIACMALKNGSNASNCSASDSSSSEKMTNSENSNCSHFDDKLASISGSSITMVVLD